MIDYFDKNDNIPSGECFHFAQGTRLTYSRITAPSLMIVFHRLDFASA